MASAQKKKKAPPPAPLQPGAGAFTAAELLRHDSQNIQIFTSVVGRVYDVTSGGKEFFGPGGPYEMFAGHDGTYNLAVVSLEKPTLDTFEHEYDEDEKECLADWLAYFDNRFGAPVGVLSDRQHSLSVSDLPRATKIPFAKDEDDEEEDSKPPASRL
mmetsp:Transcript_190/g.374  ORF Transcript_190/g.374 Transcript_190/m.374 type:complete len:157 (-) Transcript_190:14-484(-)